MEQGVNSWRDAAVAALAPAERARLGAPDPGEDVVGHMVRIVRSSTRAKARLTALVGLFPAARDRLPGIAATGADLLDDPSKFVRYEACRLLAIAHDPATLAALESAQARGVDIPWDGIGNAIRAVRQQDRDAFSNPPGWPGHSSWVLQDERSNHAGGKPIILGSAGYGTARG